MNGSLRTLGRVVCVLWALSLVACGDDIVGEWRAERTENITIRYDFTIEDDGEGEYEYRAWKAEGLNSQKGTLKWEETGDLEFEIDLRCRTSELTGCDDSSFECEMNDNGDELDCTNLTYSTDPPWEFEKRGD